MKALVIDTSVFVSSLLETDTHHKISQEFFARLKIEEKVFIVVPATIILEVANVLSRLGKHQEAALVGKHFPSLETIAIDDAFVRRAIPLLQRVKLKTADFIIAVCTFLWDATLISWDRHLLRESRKITSVSTPEDYLRSGKSK